MVGGQARHRKRFWRTGTRKTMSLFQSREEQYLTGDRAYRKISSRLLGYSVAQKLLQEVYDFYGHSLSYIESRNFTSTIFTIHLQHEPIALESAEIQLQLGTDLLAEPLAHELLHLRLPALGFPLVEMVEVPLHLNYYARDFLEMGHWVVNLVQHEINFHRFIALGFDRKHFLAKAEDPIDYGEFFNPKSRNGYPEEVDFPRWCIEYLRHSFTARHGGSGETLRYAQDALAWGSRLYPELKEITDEIDEWFANGAFKDPRQYPREVNSLLELMRIPKFSGWVILGFSDSKKPTAVRYRLNEVGRENVRGGHAGARREEDRTGREQEI
jgi:hypothetical protein